MDQQASHRGVANAGNYRGTSIIRNTTLLGPYSRTIPRAPDQTGRTLVLYYPTTGAIPPTIPPPPDGNLSLNDFT